MFRGRGGGKPPLAPERLLRLEFALSAIPDTQNPPQLSSKTLIDASEPSIL